MSARFDTRPLRWLLVSASLATIAACSRGGGLSVPRLFTPETEQSINLSRLKGTRLVVPAATADYPPIALVDGVTEVDRWGPGAGWELRFDGALLRGRYFDAASESRGAEPIEWEGLRRNYREGKEFAALGWILFQFSRPRIVDKIVLHSIDTKEFPAHRFGVRDALVQYWDTATDRWIAVVPKEGPRFKDNTIKGNVLAHVVIPIEPIRAEIVRIAIQWTNDSTRTRSFTVMGRREEYAEGTIRLTEVEVFGPREDGDVIAQIARQHLSGPAETAADSGKAEPESADPQAVLDTIWAYAQAYSDHDVNALMSVIAPTYLADGEDLDGLRERMSETFDEFPDFVFRLMDVRIEAMEQGTASVSARFWLLLNPLLPRPAQGWMGFLLIKVQDTWKIQRIQTSPS